MGCQSHGPTALLPGKVHVTVVLVAVGGGIGWARTVAKNIAYNGIQSPDHPVRSQSLYRQILRHRERERERERARERERERESRVVSIVHVPCNRSIVYCSLFIAKKCIFIH